MCTPSEAIINNKFQISMYVFYGSRKFCRQTFRRQTFRRQPGYFPDKTSRPQTIWRQRLFQYKWYYRQSRDRILYIVKYILSLFNKLLLSAFLKWHTIFILMRFIQITGNQNYSFWNANKFVNFYRRMMKKVSFGRKTLKYVDWNFSRRFWMC